MKNNKGFTLVEILSVIVLISLLLGLGIPGISRISENMKKKSLAKKIELVEESGILYGQDNKTTLQSSTCNIDGIGNDIPCKKITIYGLISDEYLDSESYNDIIYNDPDGNSLLNKCVYIYKKNNRVYAYYNKIEDSECKPVYIS